MPSWKLALNVESIKTQLSTKTFEIKVKREVKRLHKWFYVHFPNEVHFWVGVDILII